MLIYTNKKEPKWTILELSLNVLVNAIVLMMASNIFKGFYVGGFGYAVITALIIMILNYTVKPFIKLLTMPLTIFTLGLSYPLINVIILKFASLLMGNNFIVNGWLAPFFISIFISIMTLILDVIITKQIVGSMR